MDNNGKQNVRTINKNVFQYYLLVVVSVYFDDAKAGIIPVGGL